MAKNATSFQKGHKYIEGSARGANRQLRRDMTLALIAKLNDKDTLNMLEPGDKRREYIDRIVENLVLRAAGQDYIDEAGKRHRDLGDIAAIKEITDRLEGRPAQKLVGPNNGPVKIQFNTIEEVKAYLLERGIDVERLPNPMRYLEDQREG
jgi:hypothetical protein